MIGIIGGSGFGEMRGLDVIETVEPETPFGKPSGPIQVLRHYSGQKMAFLARHGKGHSIHPHRIPHRANLWALYRMGVRRWVTIGSCGAIDPTLKPGQYLVLDNLIDTVGGISFYDGDPSMKVEGEDLPARLINANAVVHIDFTHPFCKGMRRVLFQTLSEMNLTVSPTGTYLQGRGPRLETAAEIRSFGLMGAHVVGMTVGHEAALARELGICTVGLAVVANMAAGVSHEPLSSREIEEMMRQKEPEIKLAILDLVDRLPKGECEDCSQGLPEAVQSEGAI